MKTITFKKFGKFGRLGNQLWQLCAIAATVKKHNEENNENYEVALPEWNCKNFFSFPEQWFVDKETVQKSKSVHELLTEKDDFYFVNKKFLEYVKDDIQKWIEPSDMAKEILEKHVEKYKPHKKAAMHVRRGDYLTFGKGNNLLPIEYYQKNLLNSETLIFSDDPVWCEQNFPNNEVVKNNEPWVDLMLMRMCHTHVIANSTFSWWGAYGSKNVTYPDPWYKSGRVDIGLDSWKCSSWY